MSAQRFFSVQDLRAELRRRGFVANGDLDQLLAQANVTLRPGKNPEFTPVCLIWYRGRQTLFSRDAAEIVRLDQKAGRFNSLLQFAETVAVDYGDRLERVGGTA